MKDNINTFKDYILKLAKDGEQVDESNMSLEDRHVWEYYIRELSDEGYLRLIPVHGLSWFAIAPKGTVHLLNGGFSGDKQKTSIDTGKYFDMFIGVLIEEGLSLLLGGMLEN